MATRPAYSAKSATFIAQNFLTNIEKSYTLWLFDITSETEKTLESKRIAFIERNNGQDCSHLLNALLPVSRKIVAKFLLSFAISA